MERLVRDPFLRGLAQFVLIVAVSVLMLIGIMIIVTVILKYIGRLDNNKDAAILLFEVLSLPFRNLAAQITIVIGSTIPVVLATVCFKLDASAKYPATTSELNVVGRTVVIIMLIGIFAAFLALTMFATFPEAVAELAGGEAAKERVAAAVAAIMSFQAIYFAQLTGLKPK